MSEQSPVSRTSARVAAELGEATLGPLDGRYRPAVERLVEHLSEAALNRERLRIEVAWLLHLTKQQVLPGVRRLTDDEVQRLHGIAAEFDADTVVRAARNRAVTVHDVKAVEYLLKPAAGRHVAGGRPRWSTSAARARTSTTSPTPGASRARSARCGCPPRPRWPSRSPPWPGRTGRSPCSPAPTASPPPPPPWARNWRVIAHRLTRQLDRIARAEYLGKINGATGTYAAHHVAVPDADWQPVSRDFVEGLGPDLEPADHPDRSHDWQAELYADISRYNRILHNVCTDIWSYISTATSPRSPRPAPPAPPPCRTR